MPFYPQDVIIAPGNSAVVFSPTTAALTFDSSVLQVTQAALPAGAPAGSYAWSITVERGTRSPQTSVVTKQNDSGGTDQVVVWVPNANNSIEPLNPLVPIGNSVSFTSTSSASPSWQVGGGTGGALVSNGNGQQGSPPANQFTVSSQAAASNVGQYAIITDGTSYSRIWFIPAGVQAGQQSNVISYLASNGLMYFTYVPGGGMAPVVISFGVVDPGSVPPQFLPLLTDKTVGTYVAPPTATSLQQQYLTCYLLNLSAVPTSGS